MFGMASSTTVSRYGNIIKRFCKGLGLENDLKARIIINPKIYSSTALLTIRVGSINDFHKLPGLAHFIKHMLFSGTRKYFNKNRYQKFVAEHDVSTNTFIECRTNYSFKICPDHLEEALDRFVQFFLKPLTDTYKIDRKMIAINSKYEKNIPVDSWTMRQLFNLFTKINQLYDKFAAGNKDKLSFTTKSRWINVRDKLLDFHMKSFYEEHPCGFDDVKKTLYALSAKDLHFLKISFLDVTKYYKPSCHKIYTDSSALRSAASGENIKELSFYYDDQLTSECAVDFNKRSYIVWDSKIEDTINLSNSFCRSCQKFNSLLGVRNVDRINFYGVHTVRTHLWSLSLIPVSPHYCKSLLHQKICRHFCTDVQSNSRYVSSFFNLAEINCVLKLQDALQCSAEEAKILVVREPDLYLHEIDNVLLRIKYLQEEHDISAESILRDAWILHLKTDEVARRFDMMKSWNLDAKYFHECLLLLKLKQSDFIYMTKLFVKERDLIPCGNRLLYMANFLNCSVRELCARLLSQPPILRRNFILIDAALHTYKEFGVDNADILNDINCLKSTADRIRKRLTVAKEKKLEKIRPWMARSHEKHFENYIKLHKGEKEVFFPHKNRKEYLCSKFDLAEKDVKALAKIDPNLFLYNANKLVCKLDFLISIGFTKEDILLQPKILKHRYERLKSRYLELRQLGVKHPNLSLLRLNKKDYESIIKRLETTK